uniref:TOG domain-containing protein n=2 Tax=Ditylum brightwellii TaxID=49249 RepID=A0A6S9ACQ1_9STRA|mmetsp:Transcript_31842/g.42447  ORF Transcript_31842/g.42447 Transcript_31842/m.42447 type:complete len:716 (+) Transcript_31842:418-2565(+)
MSQLQNDEQKEQMGHQPTTGHGTASGMASATASTLLGGPLASGTTPSLALARSLAVPPSALLTMAPLDLFISQLSCDSSEARVDAMKKLNIVSDAVGTEGTLAELLPYLATNVAMEEEEEDEVLLILGEKLGDMVPGLIPGYRAMPILPLLERLAAVEETVVRDKAVESINKIVPLLLKDTSEGKFDDAAKEAAAASANAAPALLLAMAKRLSGADWFTAKVSAAGILPTLYRFYNAHSDYVAKHKLSSDTGPSDDEGRRELRILYKDLCEDDTPMVRRSAARHLGKFIEAVANLSTSPSDLSTAIPSKIAMPDDLRRMVVEEMVPLFRTLSMDEQDSVRLLAVANAGSVGCGLGRDPQLNEDLVFGVFQSGCSDLSWRVRHNLAKEFSTVASSLGFTDSRHQNRQIDVFNCFSSLLQDAEAEVRAAGVENIARMTQLGGPDLFLSHIAPLLPSLADDPVMEVRSKLAQALMDCCDPSICNALTDRIILQEFKPLLEGFLNDEFAEVQLHILTKLSRVSHLLNQMDVVVSSILQMSKAQNWRVREAVGRLLPHLAEARGVSFFEDHLLDPWLKLLLDQVADVRSACVVGMPKLLSVSGEAWMSRQILPHYTRIYDESSTYLTRITILRSYAALADEKDYVNETLLDQMLNLILRGLDDPVANVRMVAARGLGNVCKLCETPIIEGKLRPALTARLSDDEDDDCKFYAQIALDLCA